MNVSNITDLNSQANKINLEEINAKSNVSDSNKFEEIEEYESNLVKQFTGNTSLLNQNLQTEVSKLQVVKENLIEQSEAFVLAKKEILESADGDNYLEIANGSIAKLVNNIDQISSKAVFENVRLLETGSAYDDGKFRVPSINVGGKNYLRVQDIDVSTDEGLNNAMAIIDKALNKINSEISLCNGSIDFLTDKVSFNSGVEGSIVDVATARNELHSLKQRVYIQAQDLIKAQVPNYDIVDKLL